MPSSINAAITALLPDGKHPDSSLISPNVFVVFTEGTNNNMSVTYLQSVAGNSNRMGYAKYTSGNAPSNPSYAIAKTNSNSGSGCLKTGDTWQFGPFVGDDMIVFFLDSNSDSSKRYWSYFGPGISNPASDISTCGGSGCTHSAWAYLTDYDLTIFGWEDLSLGDADYNDLVFYLTLQGAGYYNEVPSYENGTVLVCNNNTIVSWNSFTDVNCQSWGLLETATSSGSCLTYMAIPAGWTWAPDDDTSKSIILQSYQQWAYTGSTTCYLLSVSKTQGAGYNVTTSGGTPALQSCTATVKYITPGGSSIPASSVTSSTTLCYNTECTARYVLKSILPSVACASVTRCDNSVVGTALSQTPTDFDSGVVTIPDSVTAWIAAGTGTLDVAAKLQLTGGDLTNPKIDVVVLTDFYVDTTSSGQGQRSYIDSSWSTVASSFRSLSMAVQFSVVNFVPTNNQASASYSLTSDYSFSTAAGSLSDSAYHKISCGASTAAQLRRGQNLVSAINTIATSSSLNWRSDSYRVVWVHTLCSLPADGTSTTSSINMRSIQQLTGIVPVISQASVSANVPTFSSNAPYTYTWYFSGQSANWDSPFRTSSYPPFRGAYQFAQYLKTFQVVASQGDINWITDLASTPQTLSNSGAATFTYKITWPSSVPTSTTTLYYRASMQIIGRDTVSYLIYFNHPPTMAPYSNTMSPQVATLSFTMSPTDLDQGNQLNLIAKSLPTKGSLKTSTGVTVNTVGQALAYNVFSFVYTPTNRLTDYTESFTLSVSDGCKVVDAAVSITVQKINQKPVANNVTVTMTEDSLNSNAFTLSMSDPDGNAVTGYITTAAYVSTGTVRVGNLGAGTSASTTYYTTGALPSGNLYYHLVATNSLTGYGQILIAYQAYDGSLFSNTAYIIINVNHVNHAPTITASTSILNKLTQTVGWTIQVSDADFAYPGETAVVEISSSQWGSGGNAYTLTNTYGANTFPYTGSTTYPVAFSPTSSYAAGTNVSFSGSTLTFRGYSWTAPTSGVTPSVQNITIRARDKANTLSTTVTMVFSLSDFNPPVWVTVPGTVDGTKTQGSTWNGVYFSAYDVDGPDQMNAFVFKVVSAPANGNAYLQTSSGSTSGTALKTGDTFTISTGSYAAFNTSAQVSDFRIRYTGNAAFYGTDSVTFTVTDPSGLSPSSTATASFVTTRIPTPPTSTNFTITAFEEQLVTFPIAARSTNDLSSPVQIVLVEVNLLGKFYEVIGGVDTTWRAGVTSTGTASNGGSVPGALQGDLGLFSPDASTPAGYFLYKVYEPSTGLTSTGTYQASIFITHVNHAPQSVSVTDRIKKRTVLTRRLPATDADADGTDSNLSAAILSLLPYNNGPAMYYDADFQFPITSESISAGQRLVDRTFYYNSSVIFDNSLPLMSYTFRVYDQYNSSSDSYNGYIYVSAAGDLPIVGTNTTSTPQETPVPMNLAVDVTTESGSTPTVKITSLPTKGTFTYCDDFGSCTPFGSTLPFTLTSTTGRVVYLPRDNDWGDSFTSFTYTLTDPGTGAVGTYTMNIDVTHVNKPPQIFAANFLTTAQTTSGIIINESEWRSFDWYVNDVDDLPSNLTSQVRVSFYTTQGFSFYNCTYTAGTWGTQDCTFDASAPEAVRADFAKNARVVVQNFELVSSDCTDLEALKLRYGNTSRNCEAHFRFAFVPTPLASYTPYVTITWNGLDGAGAESNTISALIFVKAVNNPPTISAPAQVVGAAGITNPFLRDSTAAATPIVVDDVDSNGNIEQMTFQIVSGKGNFTFPAAASCTAGASGSFVCVDRIAAFNQWLPDVRFNVTSGDRATLRFIIDDLGNSGDWRPNPHLTANATTAVIINAAVAAPRGNSSTLAIAVGVAAGAGLLLLGALGFFLRNAVSPPDEDYFSAATAPISAAPQSPLYQAQNTEHMSPLYKGNA